MLLAHFIEQQSASIAHTCPGSLHAAAAHVPLLHELRPQQSLFCVQAPPLGAQLGVAHMPLVHVPVQHCALIAHG